MDILKKLLLRYYGCSPRYLGALETNKSGGSINVLVELCNLYKITLNDLFSDYLEKKTQEYDISSLTGYFKLSKEHKIIIDNTISLLNNLEKTL